MDAVELHPWSEGDLDLLRRANTPELMDWVRGGVLRTNDWVAELAHAPVPPPGDDGEA
ncbi:hypothetical protein [Agromyces lapidis]|uniref:GNAT family N-acetyltransferase n=1 Tax=Agromyces lapidis TaxID=279574 RepID=A0ABV5SLE8_9MICO|nr:hypothetical protein [Agromyces lapidis]